MCQELSQIEEFRSEREQLGYKEDAYLRAQGWDSTSSTPGSYWLWSRTLKDGRTLLVSKSMALQMQDHWEHGGGCEPV